MFTGLIVERGRIEEAPKPSGRGGLKLVVGHSHALGERLPVGASVAVSGVCLTVVERAGGRSEVELSPETVARTTLGELAAGRHVNLEPALRAGDSLGGHWVQGHVDGRTEVVGREPAGEHVIMRFALPRELAPYVVYKGSIAVDGVSLTVAERTRDQFAVALIPHTLGVTTLGELAPGDRVNLETDLLGKYVVQALAERGWLTGSVDRVGTEPAGEAVAARGSPEEEPS